MNEYKIKGQYLNYILSRCVYPYEYISNNKTLSYEEYKNNVKQ